MKRFSILPLAVLAFTPSRFVPSLLLGSFFFGCKIFSDPLAPSEEVVGRYELQSYHGMSVPITETRTDSAGTAHFYSHPASGSITLTSGGPLTGSWVDSMNFTRAVGHPDSVYENWWFIESGRFLVLSEGKIGSDGSRRINIEFPISLFYDIPGTIVGDVLTVGTSVWIKMASAP